MQFADLGAAFRELSKLRRVRFIEARVVSERRRFVLGASEGRDLADEPWPVAIGCVAELLIAILALAFGDRGAIDLDGRPEVLLPELRGWGGSADVSYRTLLTRSSGVQDPRTPAEAAAGVPWTDLVSRLVASPALLSPGSAFCYAGVDLPVLVEAIQRAAGQPIVEAAIHHLLDPLGVQLQAPRTGNPNASPTAGSVEAPGLTVDDLLLITQAIARSNDETGILSAEARRRIVEARLDLLGGLAPASGHFASGFSEGAFVYGNGLVGFDGQDMGQACAVRFHPSGDFAAAVTVGGPPQIRDMAVTLLAETFGFDGPQPTAGPVPVGRLDKVTPQEAVGHYEGWARGHTAILDAGEDKLTFSRIFDGKALRTTTFEVRGAHLFADGMATGSMCIFRDRLTEAVAVCAGNLPYVMTAGSRQVSRE